MKADRTSYTLEELCHEVARRIQVAGLAQNNRQVSDLPDARTLRYYTTLGLMDRPAEILDRRARYTDRHVDQVTAVKRLQSTGRSLSEIQSLLLGLSPADLHEIAEGRVPRGDHVDAESFWSRRPTPAPVSRFEPAVTYPAGELVAPTMTGLPLAGSLTLLMPTPRRAVSTDDIDALEAVAGPLIDELVRRGLLEPTAKETSHEPH